MTPRTTAALDRIRECLREIDALDRRNSDEAVILYRLIEEISVTSQAELYVLKHGLQRRG